MIYSVKQINGLYIIITDGIHDYMNDSTLEQITNLEIGDELELDADDLLEYWEVN